MEHNILFVDDEQNILQSLKRSFHGSTYHCFYADNGKNGLDIVKEHNISTIISDMRMPGMDGVEFLKKAEEISPDTIRIILSAYADIKEIMSAVNDGHIASYITKPWKEERLHLLVKNSCDFYEKKCREKELLKELSDKNALLETMNKNLEAIVAKRTLELKERNKLLTMLLEGKPVSEILESACRSIERLLPEKSASIWLSGLDSLISPHQKVSREILGEALKKNKPVIINSFFCRPLSYKKTPLGELIIYPLSSTEKDKLTIIENITPIIEVLITQDEMLKKAEKMMDSYDDLIGALDD